MKQPAQILADGTRVVTHERLESTGGMLIKRQHLDARRANQPGVIKGWVPGHGGDVYWVQHDGDGPAAAYCFTEFELEEQEGDEKKEMRVGLLANPTPRWWLVWIENEEIGVRQDLQVEASEEHDAKVLVFNLVTDKWKVVSVEPWNEGSGD